MMAEPRRESESDGALPVIIIGAGGHARVLLEVLQLAGRRVLFATDREAGRLGQHLDGVEIRDDAAINQWSPDAVELVNAIGSVSSLAARKNVYCRFRALGYRFATVIHPASVIARSAVIRAGAQIMAGAVVQPGCMIGEDVIINTAASVDHDCRIGDHVHIAPGVTLSGNVSVGECTHIGTAAMAIQGIQIGSAALVAAGAVVVRNVPDQTKVAGVPAKAMAGGPSSEGASSGCDKPTGEPFAVMLSAAGRRVALLQLLRQSIEQLGHFPRVVATDISPLGAAYQLADERRIVPRYSDNGCLEALLSICRECRIRLIIPTIDPDLPFFAQHREAFERLGTRVMVSSLETIELVNDKSATHRWLVANGFPTVRQIDANELLRRPAGWEFPLFVKPRLGSSSNNARVVRSADDLRVALADEPTLIVQEIAPGVEYTVDVYVDEAGRCRCAVPRLRIETRGGEVTKAMTVREPRLQTLARRLVEALPGARGVLNVQMFSDAASGAINVSEINARFGGGYPLSHAAGAEMARWAVQETLGQRPDAGDEWSDGLVMLRYDQAVFMNSQQAGASVDELTHRRPQAIRSCP